MSRFKKFLIVYHQEDNDGIISGAMYYDYLTRVKGVSAENIVLAPSTYSNIVSNLKLDDKKDAFAYIKSFNEVMFTDISLNRIDLFKQLIELSNDKNADFRLKWIDHHKPVIESMNNVFPNLKTEVVGIRNTSHSAIYLMYKFLYPSRFMPLIYQILSAWDSWTYDENIDKEKADYVNKAITARLELNFDKAVKFVQETERDPYDRENKIPKIYYKEGEAISKYLTVSDSELIKNFGDFGWSLEKVKGELESAVAIFNQGSSNSIMFSSCKDRVQHGIVFKKKPDWGWSVSLYNTNDECDFDCGEYLKQKYNGGGHSGAAGCIITDEQFNKIIENGKIL